MTATNGDAASRIVQKLRSYCNVLRDDGLSYQDYLEQRAVSPERQTSE